MLVTKGQPVPQGAHVLGVRQWRAIGVTAGAEVRVVGELAMLAAAGGGQGRAQDAAAAEHKPALFPGGEPAWINRAVPSAESISLAGAPAGALAGSLLPVGSRAVLLLSVLACPAPASPGLRWDMHSFVFLACVAVCCRPAFSAASERRGCSIAVLCAQPALRGAGRATAHRAH